MDAMNADLDEKARQQQAEQKQQDFDDLLHGKMKTSDKNLQTLFKEFYEQAKQTDPTKYVDSAKNSAKSSIGAFSAKLETRRQKIRDMKESAMNIDKDHGAAKKQESTSKQDVDASKDKASATPDPKSET